MSAAPRKWLLTYDLYHFQLKCFTWTNECDSSSPWRAPKCSTSVDRRKLSVCALAHWRGTVCALVLYEVKHKDLCDGIRRHKFRQISHGVVVADKISSVGKWWADVQRNTEEQWGRTAWRWPIGWQRVVMCTCQHDEEDEEMLRWAVEAKRWRDQSQKRKTLLRGSGGASATRWVTCLLTTLAALAVIDIFPSRLPDDEWTM